MGRSVSYPSNTVALAFTTVDSAYYCRTCDAPTDSYDECETCKSNGDRPDIRVDEFGCRDNWEDLVEGLKSSLKKALPSLGDSDRWLGNEDHVILEDGYVVVGVSEYCGLVSVWAVADERGEPDEEDGGIREKARYARALATVGPAILKALKDCGHEVLRKMGSFSNGEGVYERVAA